MVPRTQSNPVPKSPNGSVSVDHIATYMKDGAATKTRAILLRNVAEIFPGVRIEDVSVKLLMEPGGCDWEIGEYEGSLNAFKITGMINTIESDHGVEPEAYRHDRFCRCLVKTIMYQFGYGG